MIDIKTAYFFEKNMKLISSNSTISLFLYNYNEDSAIYSQIEKAQEKLKLFYKYY
jgi:hypothetical protein